MSGGRVYGQHGSRHSPRGSDPSPTDVWIEIADAVTAWSAVTSYVVGNHVNHGNANWVCIANNTNVEPGVDASSPLKWEQSDVATFVNGANAAPTTAVPNPVPMRFRLSVGPPNDCDYDNGTNSTWPLASSIVAYTDHQIEIQGDVDGLVIGDTVFVLPLEYQHDHDVPYHTHDIYGAYVPCRLLSTGEFIWGQV